MATKRKSQTQRVKEFLMKNKRISAAQAETRFGVKNLRARMNDLKNEGFSFTTKPNPKNRKQVIYTTEN